MTITKKGKIKAVSVSALAAFLVALVLIPSSGATAADSPDLVFAREALRNCQLLQGLPNLTTSERNDANRCVSEQTKLIAALTTTVPPTTTPPAPTTTSSSPSPTTPVPTTTSPTPMPTPSPTVTPPPPTRLKNCVNILAQCGYPDTGSTGTPAGTTLTAYTGPIQVRTAGTVIDGKTIKCGLQIYAANVTIRNSRIVGTPTLQDCNYLVEMTGGTLSIQDSSLDCIDHSGTGVGGSNFAALRLLVMNCENGFDVGSHTSVVDSYITGVQEVNGGHGDGIQNYTPEGSSDILIEHNTFFLTGSITSSIITWPTATNLRIKRNFLMAGAYTLYCPEDPAPGGSVEVSSNRFFPWVAGAYDAGVAHAPHYGLTDECSDSRIAWFDNFRDDTLAQVAA